MDTWLTAYMVSASYKHAVNHLNLLHGVGDLVDHRPHRRNRGGEEPEAGCRQEEVRHVEEQPTYIYIYIYMYMSIHLSLSIYIYIERDITI